MPSGRQNNRSRSAVDSALTDECHKQPCYRYYYFVLIVIFYTPGSKDPEVKNKKATIKMSDG